MRTRTFCKTTSLTFPKVNFLGKKKKKKWGWGFAEKMYQFKNELKNKIIE